MSWRDILQAGAYRAGMRALRQGGGYPAVYRIFQGRFPEENRFDIVEAARRTVAAFEAGSKLGRAGRVNPLPPTGAPWLLGAGQHPETSPGCRWRYDVTAGFQAEQGDEVQWVTVRDLDADHSLSPDELRALVTQTVGEWAGQRDTLPGAGGPATLQLVQMRVDFVFRC